MQIISDLLQLSPGARPLKADLHVHTPASFTDPEKDFRDATPEDVVRHAVAAGLDIIAVTDHNTAEWCDKVRTAAEGAPITVFPGIEISTPQGHLLAIFDQDTTKESIHGLLMNAGTQQDKLGSVLAVTSEPMDAVAPSASGIGNLTLRIVRGPSSCGTTYSASLASPLSSTARSCATAASANSRG